jgi:hypothetical protein
MAHGAYLLPVLQQTASLGEVHADAAAGHTTPPAVWIASEMMGPTPRVASGLMMMPDTAPSTVVISGAAGAERFMGGCQMIIGGDWLARRCGGGVQPHIVSHSRRAAPEPP